MYQFKKKNHFQLMYDLPSILRDILASEMLECEKVKGLGNDSIVCVYFLDEWREKRLREVIWFIRGHTVSLVCKANYYLWLQSQDSVYKTLLCSTHRIQPFRQANPWSMDSGINLTSPGIILMIISLCYLSHQLLRGTRHTTITW